MKGMWLQMIYRFTVVNVDPTILPLFLFGTMDEIPVDLFTEG